MSRTKLQTAAAALVKSGPGKRGRPSLLPGFVAAIEATPAGESVTLHTASFIVNKAGQAPATGLYLQINKLTDAGVARETLSLVKGDLLVGDESEADENGRIPAHQEYALVYTAPAAKVKRASKKAQPAVVTA